jgi:hypothetical protein
MTLFLGWGLTPVPWGGGSGPSRSQRGLPPPQAPPSLQIRALRPRFAAVASYNAAAENITASTAPGERANLLLRPLGRVGNFVRRLIALFP